MKKLGLLVISILLLTLGAEAQSTACVICTYSNQSKQMYCTYASRGRGNLHPTTGTNNGQACFTSGACDSSGGGGGGGGGG